MHSSSPPPLHEVRQPDLGEGWTQALGPEFNTPYFADLKRFLLEERNRHKVYPRGRDMFNAFLLTPLPEVRVVILGQDPYHGPGQAHGLCFSVPQGVKPPPSLENIFKELRRDLQIPYPSNGDLSPWARQGVLLLNTTLTVRDGQAASHQGQGWERFTDKAIRVVSEQGQGRVFLLWGRHAQDKEAIIDSDRHYILKAPHPSPLSAHRGFIGCGHFSAVNEILTAQGGPPIDWAL